VIEHAEAVEGDDDDGEGEVARPVADIVAGGEGDAPAADAFDRERREARAVAGDGAVERGKVDGAIFGAGGDEGGGGFAEVNGVGFVEGEAIAGSFAEEEGVTAVAGGNRLKGGGVMAGGSPGADEPGGEPGFADTGVGAGDEIAAHGERVGGSLP